jgi:hypothetical protein
MRREPKGFMTASVRRSTACGVVVNFLDEQVSPTRILVLPAVPLPGGNGEKAVNLTRTTSVDLEQDLPETTPA